MTQWDREYQLTVLDQNVSEVVGDTGAQVDSGTEVENVALDVSGVSGGLGLVGSSFLIESSSVCASSFDKQTPPTSSRHRQ